MKAMKRLAMILTSAALVGAFSLTSCNKTDDAENLLTEFSQDDDEVASYFEDVYEETEEVTNPETGTKSMEVELTGSGTRNVETSFSGDTIIRTVTYNNFVNGNAQRQRTKNGQVIMKTIHNQYPGEYKRIVTMNNFTINGNKIEGEKVIVRSAQNQYQFTVTLTNGKVTFTDGTQYTREFTRTRTWASGYATPYFIWDDEFEVEGVSTGVNRNGKTYTHQITTPLYIKNACRWIVSGTIDLTVDGKSATIDYGDGTCDAKATVTMNGETVEINLRAGM